MRPHIIEQIRAEQRAITDRKIKAGRFNEIPPSGPDAGLLRLKTADEWLRTQHGKPPARRLFGDLWHENELCILFADTNKGKSILAVQIGAGLAKNYATEPFACEGDQCRRVLYIDFELTAQQFAHRYSHSQWGDHHFGDNFFRAEFNSAANDPIYYSNYHTYLLDAMEHSIRDTKAQALIIDNLTCLGTETGHASGARTLIQNIRKLKTKHKLSVLALAHTPKRDPRHPITVNDLHGSKMLINFADSAFAIGQSHTQPGMYYLKQVKQRTGTQLYGAANVCTARIITDHTHLRFQFTGYAHERDHLQPATSAIPLEQHTPQILALHATGLSCRHIATQLGISHTSVNKVLRDTREEGVSS